MKTTSRRAVVALRRAADVLYELKSESPPYSGDFTDVPLAGRAVVLIDGYLYEPSPALRRQLTELCLVPPMRKRGGR